MFMLELTYLKPIEEVDRFLVPHRNYLQTQYDTKLLVFSGPMNPRSGGLILLSTNNPADVDKFISGDPFDIEGIAKYRVIDFDPVKHDARFACFIPPKTT